MSMFIIRIFIIITIILFILNLNIKVTFEPNFCYSKEKGYNGMPELSRHPVQYLLRISETSYSSFGGFMSDKSTTDQILALRQILENTTEFLFIYSLIHPSNTID